MTRRMLVVCSAAVVLMLVGLSIVAGGRRSSASREDAPQKVDASLAAAIIASLYRVGPVDGSGDFQAPNPQQGYHARFTPTAVQLTPAGADAQWQIGFELTRFGYGASLVPVAPGVVTSKGTRVDIARGAITEWYINRPSGLEQGFTITTQPAGSQPGSPLRLDLAVAGNLRARVNGTGTSVALVSDSRGHVLSYDHLVSTDAAGRELPSHFETSTAGVTIVVDDATATYPVTIDPTFTHQAWLKASNTGASDLFGSSVAISGNTAVVGATQEASAATGVNGDQADNSASGTGAAYVFVESAGVWTQQAYLKASIVEPGAQFGTSVAISGDTVAVGAPANGALATSSGSVYVFVRTGSTWSPQALVKAPNADFSDLFGGSVALSSDTLLVGAVGEDSAATDVDGDASNNSAGGAGAAYVFTRAGTAWTQQAYLKASNAEAGDNFGNRVAIDGETAVITANSEDGGVAGVNGNQADNSKAFSGAAYVFVRAGTTWSQEAYLKASNVSAIDRFGSAAAISGNTVVVTALNEDSGAAGVNGNELDNSLPDSGAAYVFTRSGTAWSQQAYLKASSPGSLDFYGMAAAIHGNVVVVGAGSEDSNATGVNGDASDNSQAGSGAAYVFVRTGTTWVQQAYLKGPVSGADNFGSGIGVSGSYVIVGARAEASSATGVNGDAADNSMLSSGAAVVFAISPPLSASAGSDQTLEATSASGASLTLDGTASAGGEGPLTYTWRDASSTIVGTSATVNLTRAIGSHTFTLTVSDGTTPVTDSVTIVVQDTVGPSISAVAPAIGATYAFGQSVIASYSCTDAGSTTAKCVGTVAAGSSVNTTTSGAQTFTIAATDTLGNASSFTFNYTVLAPIPMVTGVTHTSCTGAGGSITNCPIAGGGTLNIHGTGFGTVAAAIAVPVSICSGAPTLVSTTQVQCTLAAANAGSVRTVLLTVGGVASGGPPVNITAAQVPTVTSLTLASCTGSGTPTLTNCPVAGGNTLTIVGTNFHSAGGTMAVTPTTICGGVATIVGSTTATCTTVASGTGTTLRVTANGGQSSGTPVVSYSPAPLPTLSSITAANCLSVGGGLVSCPVSGGGTLTMSGTNFTGPSGSISVPAGVCAAPLTVQSGTQLTCPLAPGAAGTTVNVTATTNGGTTTGRSLTYASVPTVTSVSHPQCSMVGASFYCPAAGGGTLTINGTGFGQLSSHSVTVSNGLCNGAASHTPGFEDTQVTCSLAAAAPGTARAVVVTSIGGTSPVNDVVVAVAQTPTITQLSHPLCWSTGATGLIQCPVAGGGTLTITGTNFSTSPSANTVSGGVCAAGTLATLDVSHLTCTLAPAAAGTLRQITVTSNSATSTTIATVVHASAPTVTSVTHASCTSSGASLHSCPVAGGGTLTITGTNFGMLAAAPVSVGDNLCADSPVHVAGFEDTRLTCSLAPAAPSTIRFANVTASGGTSSNSTVAVAMAPVPAITAISHSQCDGSGTTSLSNCPGTGGGTLTITGSGFFGPVSTTSVTGGACAGPLTSTGTELTCTLAPGVASRTITVVANGGVTGPATIDYNSAPTVSNRSYTTTSQALLSGNLISDAPAAFDADGDELTALLVTPALHGIATVAADGSFTYQPSGSYAGADSFTFRVHDGAAFSGIATVSLLITDATAPVIAPHDDVLALATGPLGATVTFASPTASDAVSGPVPVTCTPASGSIFPIGTTTVTCTASDAAGNSASAMFTVTVTDQSAPTVTVPANITAAATSAAGAAVTFSSSATDVVDGVVATTCTPTSGSTFAIGTTTVTCSASDAAANSASATFTVTVTDQSAPTVTVPANITAAATSAAGAAVTFSSSATDVVDGAVATTCTPISGSIFAIGTTTVTCSASDAAANSASATFTVTVTDQSAPMVTVPANITAAATSAAGAAVTFSSSATDVVDGVVATTCAPTSGSTFAIGTTTVTCTASDAAGNSASATFTVTVTDQSAPMVTVPANITAAATSAAGAAVTFTSTATDVVDGAVATTCAPTSGSTFAIGTTTVTCSASDAATNSASATFTVTVTDQSAPTVTVPANITAAAMSAAGAAVTFTASATDVVDGPVATTCAPISGSVFPIGTTTVICTASDAAANSASATFTVTVTDQSAPTVTVPANITAAATSAAGATVTFTSSATDVVDGAVATTCAPVSGSIFAIGTTTVTCSASDAAGNLASATFAVTVTNVTAPVFTTVPANLTVDATSAAGALAVYTTPTATDVVSGSITSVCTPAPGAQLPIGTTTVTCTATGGSGLTSQVNFTITVRSAAAMTTNLAATVTNIAALAGMSNLNAQVQAALTSLADGKGKTASNQLGALINAAQAQSGKKLTAAQAAAIVAAAQQIQAVIGG